MASSSSSSTNSSASASSSSSGLTFKVHPLVILNISDHYTRVKSQSQSQSQTPRVYGCLIGLQRGRTLEIFNSFELLYDSSADALDRPFLDKKQELYKKVFPDLYILGWYSTATWASQSDMAIHKALMDINESPVYMLLNPDSRDHKDLPLFLFESEVHLLNGAPHPIFVQSSYTIETVEAERISVDHVAHLKPNDGASAATHLAANLTALHSAISMLNSRIRVLQHYLMSHPQQPLEFSLLRQLSSLLRRLPAIHSLQFHDHFFMDYNDTLLLTYLAIFTNCSSTMNELVEKLNTAYDRHSRRGGRTAYF